MTPVFIANALDPAKQIHCDVPIDTGAAGLVLPKAWKDRLGALPVVRTVELETADQRVVPGEVCGPVKIQIEGFDVISNEGISMEMHPQDGGYEPLLGYLILGQSRAAVDMVGHRLVPVKHVDLKVSSRMRAPVTAARSDGISPHPHRTGRERFVQWSLALA